MTGLAWLKQYTIIRPELCLMVLNTSLGIFRLWYEADKALPSTCPRRIVQLY